MPKHKGLPNEDGGDNAGTLSSYEHYGGMNDTMLPTGSDGLRLEFSEQLQIVNSLLAGDTPTLYAIEAKKKLDDIDKEIAQFELVEDHDVRESIYREIVESLASTKRYIEVTTKISTNDVTKATMGVKPLADPKMATPIVPPGWDDTPQLLH
ncbi:MAG: hypothetical protein AAB869_01180 [Patescibacteria group bacterium]